MATLSNGTEQEMGQPLRESRICPAGAKLLGHSSIAVTARYLEHLTNHQAVTMLGGVDLPKVG
jgi:hypothetical protein